MGLESEILWNFPEFRPESTTKAPIPEAMCATELTSAESRDPAKQMAVRRAFEKAAGHSKAFPLPGSIHSVAIQSLVSPLTAHPTVATTAEHSITQQPTEWQPEDNGDCGRGGGGRLLSFRGSRIAGMT